MKKLLDSVTLLGVDCVDIDRLILAAEICQKDFEFASVKLLTSISKIKDERIISIKPITSAEAYSQFIICDLDKYVDTPHVLIIQYDGFILNPDAWSDEFLQYDYIGAPWLTNNRSVNKYGFPKELLGKFVVGNGGFSLRSKKLTSLCANLDQNHLFKRYHPEDVVLCVENRKMLEDNGIQFAPISWAQQFSYESVDKSKNDYSWNGQFGFHGLSWTDISKWLDAHPEYEGKIVNDPFAHSRKADRSSVNN